MKKGVVAFVLLCAGILCRGQILKDISNRIANDAKSKTEQKISSKADQVIDSLTKKKTKTGKTNNNTSTQTAPATASTTPATTVTQQNNPSNNSGNNSKPLAKPDPYSSDGSFITLKVFSTKVILRNLVSISGASIKYQSLNKVVMTITAENKASQSKDIPLKDDGTFATTWQPGSDGGYSIQVKSSDGKALQSEHISVYELKEMDSITEEPKKETKEAFDNVKKDVNDPLTRTMM